MDSSRWHPGSRDDPASVTQADAVPTPLDEEEGPSSFEGITLSPKEYKVIRQRMEVAENFARQEGGFIKTYDRCVEIYNGIHWPTAKYPPEEHRPVINYIKHVIESMTDATAFRLGEVYPKPRSPIGQENAQTVKLGVAYMLEESGVYDEAKWAYKDCGICDLGIVMTGWEFETEKIHLTDGRQPVEGEEPDPEQITQMIADGKEPETPVPLPDVITDQFFCRRLDPRLFRVSPEAGANLDQHDWCGYVELRRVDEVKADPRYKNTHDLKGTNQDLQKFLSSSENETTDPSEAKEHVTADLRRVELWHYFERKRRLYVVLTPEKKKPLYVGKWSWKHKRYPFRTVMGPRANKNEFYPSNPRLLDLFPMQQEINRCRAMIHNMSQRDACCYLYDSTRIDAKAAKVLASGRSHRAVGVKGAPAGVVELLQPSQISPALYQVFQSAFQDLSAISTVDQYQFAMAPTKRMNTTEVEAVRGSGGARQAADQARFEELVSGVANDCLDLMQQYVTRSAMLPIYEGTQLRGWQPMTPELIRGDYDMKVYVNSTTVKDQRGRVEEIGFLFQALTPFLQMINPAPLLKQLLENMPEIKDVDAILAGPPPMPQDPAALPPGEAIPPDAGAAPPGAGMEGLDPAILEQLMAGGIPQ